MCEQRKQFTGVFAFALVAMVALALLCPNTAQAKMTLKEEVGDDSEIKAHIYGFSQFEIRGGDGEKNSDQISNDLGGDTFFQAQRVRVGFNYFHDGPVAGKLFLDFNQSHTNREGNLPKVIKDAFVAYKFSNSAFLRLGMIKTPVGMMFTVPGWNLDIIERQALEKGLVLERDFGLMLSGRLIGQERFSGKKQMKVNGLEMGTERQGYGFGYDIGVFNPAGRSSAVIWDSDLLGEALAYTGRVHWDWGPELHVEASFGESEDAGGLTGAGAPSGLATTGPDDYSVMDFGVASELWDYNIEVRFEYIMGESIRGVDGWDQDSMSLTFGYLFRPNAEFAVRTFQASSERPMMGGGLRDTDLGNTYVGFNIFPHRVSDKHRDLQRNKIVINYIITNGDDIDAMTPWAGIGGFLDDAWGIQWQYKY